MPTRLSTVNDIVLWHLANRTLLVDTEAGEVFRADGHTRAETPQDDGHGTVYLGRIWHHIKHAPAHRVVWLARHGHIPGQYVVTHDNDRRWDNRIANLLLMTRSEMRRRAGGFEYAVAMYGADINGADDRPTIKPYATAADVVYGLRHRTAHLDRIP